MNKRLLKIAAYLGSQGLYTEAAQIKKLAEDDEEMERLVVTITEGDEDHEDHRRECEEKIRAICDRDSRHKKDCVINELSDTQFEIKAPRSWGAFVPGLKGGSYPLLQHLERPSLSWIKNVTGGGTGVEEEEE